jgi:outer membrane lipoprotein SlyB
MARHALFVPLIVAALAGCEPQTTMTPVPYDAPAVATHVSYGRIIAEHPVTMQQTANGDRIGGALVGGLAGAIIGNQFGGGTGKDLMTGAGAVTGAVIGGNLASQTRTYVSQAWTVRLDNGGTMTIIQASNTFYVGMRIRVVQNGSQTYLTP